MDPFVGLARRWAVDWLAAADASVCDEILAPEYTVVIGGHRLGPRDAYVEAALGQLERFPGLGLTVHELIARSDHVAVRFTEHGPSPRHDGRAAAWGGVALFRWDGQRLTDCFAEEDYLSRRRQLASGTPDPIEPPAPAPWATVVQRPDPAAEEVVRRWLQRGDFSRAERDDSWLGHHATVDLAHLAIDVDELFSAGNRVAFHGIQLGEVAGAPDRVGLHLAGLVTVEHGEVAGGRVVRDRLGLSRALAGAVAP
jgi:hypothetical protein